MKTIFCSGMIETRVLNLFFHPHYGKLTDSSSLRNSTRDLVDSGVSYFIG
jgi:hypothetical protein